MSRASVPAQRIDQRRVRALCDGTIGRGPVVYWMSRDQRAQDNWALLYAQEQARANRVPLIVLFCLAPEFLGATHRQYAFMVAGLRKLEEKLARFNIPFSLVCGSPSEEVARALRQYQAGLLITDFSPLRINQAWKTKVLSRVTIPVHEVDAHNIVPCWVASDKQEYAAYTIRPKIQRLLPTFLTDFPRLRKQVHAPVPVNDWTKAERSLKIDSSVPEVHRCTPGEMAARRAMRSYLRDRLASYHLRRNDPNQNGQSGLSPYLHFGQLSAQRLAFETMQYGRRSEATETFLEELIVRRELAENFCTYNPHYDRITGFPDWAKRTLTAHQTDVRPFRYTRGQLEKSATHDPLWNAAQQQMVRTGTMHGYLRMYWAKKILEWTRTPDKAMRLAIYLNDKYQLDGRDPSGYAGIAWCIGGVHDRAWAERPVFGKIRYMSFDGCRRKFDVDRYIRRFAAD